MDVRNMSAVRLKLALMASYALLALCWHGTPSCAAAGDHALSDRVLAVVQPAAASTFIDLSADRRVLYVAGANDDRPGKIAETLLSIYDVANPASPHLLSTLPLGDTRTWQLVASGERLLIQHGWNDPKRPFGVTIVDVHDASYPAVAGNVALAGSLALSHDGATAQIRSYWPEKKEIAFKLDRPDQPISDNQIASDLETVARQAEPFPGQFEYERDRTGPQSLTLGSEELHVLTLAQDAAPRRTLSVALKHSASDARLLSDGTAAVVVGPDGVRIVSLKPPALDMERLRKLHALLLAEYPSELRKRLASDDNNPRAYRVTSPPKLDTFYFGLAVALEEAGVRDLLDDAKAGGLPVSARVAILNDYGFWLSKSIDPFTAVEALQKVVKLAPDRAVAALNLGDAARSAMAEAPTWQQKTELSGIGLRAYAAYRKLKGQEAPAAQEFALLHGNEAVSRDVCSYVATFYNQGRQSELWGNPDPVDIAGDGKLRHVYTFTQGTAHNPVIVATTASKPQDDYLMFESEVDFGESTSFAAEPHVLPFKTGYFVVYEEDGGPSMVVKPNGPTVCKFKRTFTSVLVEDHAPAICRKAVTGATFEKVPRRKLPDQGVKVASGDLDLTHTDTASVYLTESSDVTFVPNGSRSRLGYFEIASGAGRGCDVNGVAFLDGDSLEKSTRARNLIDAQRQMMNCMGSTAFVVHTNGEFLIEIDGGQGVQRTVPPRLLLRSHQDRIETVCRVEQRPSYAAESPNGPR